VAQKTYRLLLPEKTSGFVFGFIDGLGAVIRPKTKPEVFFGNSR
jgi:hypothetical protein